MMYLTHGLSHCDAENRETGGCRVAESGVPFLNIAVLAVAMEAQLFKHEIRFKNLLVNHALVCLVLPAFVGFFSH